jgi:hypothetical protein
METLSQERDIVKKLLIGPDQAAAFRTFLVP